MKKKKQNHNEQRRRVSDFDTLNSQLGSFDLEPPRIYRDNAQRKKKVRRAENEIKFRLMRAETHIQPLTEDGRICNGRIAVVPTCRMKSDSAKRKIKNAE